MFEGVFHHQEVDLGNGLDLNGKNSVDLSQQALVVVLEMFEVLGQDFYHFFLLLLLYCLYHQVIVGTEEEKTATGPQRLLRLFDLRNVFLQVQRPFYLFRSESFIESQGFEDSVGVGSDLDVQGAHFLEVIVGAYFALYLHSFLFEPHAFVVAHFGVSGTDHVILPLSLAEFFQLGNVALVWVFARQQLFPPLLEEQVQQGLLSALRLPFDVHCVSND